MYGESGTSHPHGPSSDKRLESELAPLIAAAQASPMATAFVEGQALGVIEFINDAFVTLLRQARGSLLGTPVQQLLLDGTDLTTCASISAALGDGCTGSWELPFRRQDGSEFLAAVFLAPAAGAKGHCRHGVLSIIEVGGRVERLLDERNAFHNVYEKAPGLIAIADGPQHRFTFANAAYKRFVHREELVGLTVAEAMPEMVAQGFVAILDQVYRTGEPYIGRGAAMRFVDEASGLRETQYCDFIYQAVRNARGAIIGLFCEGYDVTKQRKTADELAALQADLVHASRVNAMGTMATTLAHELNQPLSAISNYSTGVQRLLDSASFDEVHLRYAMTGIGEAAQRAAEIIRNLHNLVRRREPARAEFNLRRAVVECVRLVRATAPPGMEIHHDVPQTITVMADRIQIQQVLINLLRNACDAAEGSANPKVSVTAEEDAEDLTVCVCDTGLGVPAEAARGLFSWTDSPREGGLGLGLAISRTIMDWHGGRIWLQDSGPQGSTFCFSVPCVPASLQADISGG